MKIKRLLPLQIGVAFVAGAVAPWFMPSDWAGNIFLFVIGVCLLSGIIARVDSKESKPLSSSLKVISYLVIGTTTPNAQIKDSLALRLFFITATSLIAATMAIWIASVK